MARGTSGHGGFSERPVVRAPKSTAHPCAVQRPGRGSYLSALGYPSTLPSSYYHSHLRLGSCMWTLRMPETTWAMSHLRPELCNPSQAGGSRGRPLAASMDAIMVVGKGENIVLHVAAAKSRPVFLKDITTRLSCASSRIAFIVPLLKFVLLVTLLVFL